MNRHLDLLRRYFTLGAIIGALPNNIVNGQAIDAVPVMADFNWIVAQVNANAVSTSALATAVTNAIGAIANPITTYTPVLAFGGASVGITYGRQEGYWAQIGKLAFVFGNLSITNIGSSTGQATITLPVATLSTLVGIHVPLSLNVIFAAFAGMPNPGQVVGRIVPNTSTFVPSVMATNNSQTTIDFTQFNVQASTEFSFMGFYVTN